MTPDSAAAWSGRSRSGKAGAKALLDRLGSDEAVREYFQDLNRESVKARKARVPGDDYQPPPEGWRDFGYHAPLSPAPPLTLSDEVGEDLLPRWERHKDGSPCDCDVDHDGEPSEWEPEGPRGFGY